MYTRGFLSHIIVEFSVHTFINISVKCIFWQIFKDIVENKDPIGRNTAFENLLKLIFIFYYLKDFIFCKYICKMYNVKNIRFSKKV